MVFGFGRKRKKAGLSQAKEFNPAETPEISSYQSIVKLRQEVDNLEAKLRQAQQDNVALQRKHAELNGDYNSLINQNQQLETEKQAIERVAEMRIKQSKTEAMEDLETMYKAKIRSLNEAKQRLEDDVSGLSRQLAEKEARYSSSITSRFTEFKQEYEARIAELRQALENAGEEKEALEKKLSRYDVLSRKIDERMKEMLKSRNPGSNELKEGQVIEVMIFTRGEEKRRKSCYNAATADDSLIYVRTLMDGIEGLDAEVVITSSQPEARLITNPGIVPGMGKEVVIEFAEKTQKGMSALCRGGKEIIITNVGESVPKLDKPTNVYVYGEKDGCYLGRRL